MNTIWVIIAEDTIWGDGSPGLDVEKIVAVCTSKEEAEKLIDDGKIRLDYPIIQEVNTNQYIEY